MVFRIVLLSLAEFFLLWIALGNLCSFVFPYEFQDICFLFCENITGILMGTVLNLDVNLVV